MADSKQKPELDDYDIKEEFKNLLFNSMGLTSQYDNLLLEIQEFIDTLDISTQLTFYYMVDKYDMKIENQKKTIAKMGQQFDRFDKLYYIGKLFNRKFSETEQQALSIIEQHLKQKNNSKN
ncbi:MAG: hypothetical protein FWE18_03600 [Alphaproteobacteria bacterium]|nr:hypothetical protein [Alphaproteobacteria bacterium]